MAVHIVSSQSEFKKYVLESDKVVLVDFWAEWCPPCRMVAPILEHLGKKMDKNVDIAKVNIEASSDNQTLAREHEVMSIPNMKIYKEGKIVGEIIGVRPEQEIEQLLLNHV